jgi:hypothetical protein
MEPLSQLYGSTFNWLAVWVESTNVNADPYTVLLRTAQDGQKSQRSALTFCQGYDSLCVQVADGRPQCVDAGGKKAGTVRAVGCDGVVPEGGVEFNRYVLF